MNMEHAQSAFSAIPATNLTGPEIDRFAKIIDRFLKDLSRDESAQAFAQKHKVSFRFSIKDTDIQFYLSFADGTIASGMGEPPFKPDVNVKVDADTFDGIFTKRVEGVQAFKSGKLNLGGNFLKATAILNMDFSAVYIRARESVTGGRQPAPGGPTPPEISAEPAGPAPAPPPPSPSYEKFNQILAVFLQRMAGDPDMLAFARGKNLAFQFVLKDAGTHFYMIFLDGQVNTGLGDGPVKPDATVKTTAETIDAMFTGRIDGVAALKSGKLSVGGNVFKALSLQKLHFGTLYRQVCAEMGAPDFETVQAPLTTPSSSAVESQAALIPISSEKQVATPTVIHRTGDIRDEILQVNNELYARGWITSTGGNISARSEGNSEEIWITPSAIFKGDLRADYMVKIDLDGNILDDTPFNASSERWVHTSLYRTRPEIKAVIHTHAIHSTLMALSGTPWLPISADAAFLGDIPVVPFILPGTPELGEAVARAIGATGVAAIMQNHGLVVAGSDLRRAADTTEVIEITAQKLLYCRQLGIQPATIPDDLVDILKDMGSMMA